MKKFIVITSIFKPTEAVEKFSRLNDWQLVVVGDKKTPKDWRSSGAVYLSPEDQEKLGYKILEHLPWNHYCRKMIGYLYAMQKGADIIADTDDDNIPYDNWDVGDFSGEFNTISSDSCYVNVYSKFTDKKIWPRGYPLKLIQSQPTISESVAHQDVGVWQYLADRDPDVDAIYRLVVGDEVLFDKNDPFVLSEGTVSPFNSQNTFFRKDVFPLLYLPAFVTFRFTDILRGLVAQPILWKAGYKLAFGPATVYQDRNAHDFLKDFESELPVYLQGENIPHSIPELIKDSSDIKSSLMTVYEDLLLKTAVVPAQEIALLKAWLADISALE
jgi:hypothetical protein